MLGAPIGDGMLVGDADDEPLLTGKSFCLMSIMPVFLIAVTRCRSRGAAKSGFAIGPDHSEGVTCDHPLLVGGNGPDGNLARCR